MTHATEDDAPKLEFTALVREEADRDGLTYGKFRSNAEWFEFEPVLTVGRHEVELNDLPLLDANLRWIELELARVHCERDIGRPICGGRGYEPGILDATAQHQEAACGQNCKIR